MGSARLLRVSSRSRVLQRLPNRAVIPCVEDPSLGKDVASTVIQTQLS